MHVLRSQKVNALLEDLYSAEEGLITSGTLSQSPSQFASLWAYRELIPEAAGKAGKVYKYDISVPVTEFVNVTNKVRDQVQGKVKEVLGYGHVGDGMSPPPFLMRVGAINAHTLWMLFFSLQGTYISTLSQKHGPKRLSSCSSPSFTS